MYYKITSQGRLNIDLIIDLGSRKTLSVTPLKLFPFKVC